MSSVPPLVVQFRSSSGGFETPGSLGVPVSPSHVKEGRWQGRAEVLSCDAVSTEASASPVDSALPSVIPRGLLLKCGLP